jgi:3'5'-cyclic nucleotide phosphodiesterase
MTSTGVPNAQLIKEKSAIASLYQGKSVAERNSIDVAFKLLMDDSYSSLRRAIYSTEEELLRFRQLVVNAVLATDIVDKDLKKFHNTCWDRAYNDDTIIDSRERASLRATIIIMYLMQASDVAHTMQHWHVYRQCNEKFFLECYEAFRNGRAEVDPSTYWYEGEIGFFDNYIIPLANKLKECKLFGVSSDEYLDYALRNRQEWLEKGKDIVAEMIEKMSGQDMIK